MTVTLALDVYGTLIDPLGVTTLLRSYVGDDAPAFARAWREKQLEYLFRRALMRDYRDFPSCTREALRFTDLRFGSRLPAEAFDQLMAAYLELPAYAGAAKALEQLRAGSCRLYAFSNGLPEDLERLLANAGLARLLDGIVSVHPVESFKPDPAVYRHFIDSARSLPRDTWLVSGNPFDVIGASHAGWKTAWVRRDDGTFFDPWGIEPTVTIADLEELAGAIRRGPQAQVTFPP